MVRQMRMQLTNPSAVVSISGQTWLSGHPVVSQGWKKSRRGLEVYTDSDWWASDHKRLDHAVWTAAHLHACGGHGVIMGVCLLLGKQHVGCGYLVCPQGCKREPGIGKARGGAQVWMVANEGPPQPAVILSIVCLPRTYLVSKSNTPQTSQQLIHIVWIMNTNVKQDEQPLKNKNNTNTKT